MDCSNCNIYKSVLSAVTQPVSLLHTATYCNLTELTYHLEQSSSCRNFATASLVLLQSPVCTEPSLFILRRSWFQLPRASVFCSVQDLRLQNKPNLLPVSCISRQIAGRGSDGCHNYGGDVGFGPPPKHAAKFSVCVSYLITVNEILTYDI